MKYVLGMKQYRTNRFYAIEAEKRFTERTTSTDLKSTLRSQKFWNRIFDLPLVTTALGTRLLSEKRLSLPMSIQDHSAEWSLGRAKVQSTSNVRQTDATGMTVTTTFKIHSGKIPDSSFYAGIQLDNWKRENFICAPGAAYNGGRFQRFKTTYPPFYPKRLHKKDIPIVTTEIPGLSVDDKQSQMDLLMREITSPMLGIWIKSQKICIWLSTHQLSEMGNTGFSVKENLESSTLTIDIVTPMVREKTSSHAASAMPSWDRSCTLSAGDTGTIVFHVDIRECHCFDDFYNAFKQIIAGQKNEPDLAPDTLPFSSAWQLIETLYNDTKWNARHGYYHAGFLPPFIAAEAWSAGWTGGLALSYALLNLGDSQSADRALRNLAFFMSDSGQSDKGIFYATSDGINWGGDDYFANYGIGSRKWIQVRRCGDYLYFLIKHFRLLESRGLGHLIQPEWKHKTLKCADAICEIWNQNHHFGQYIDPDTLKIRVGNSDAGNIIPAALAACAGYFNKKIYLDTAQAALTKYYNHYLENGFTAGGPLEILCAPDCESAVNLLESLIVVFEESQLQEWLDKAHLYVNYVRTWFYTYNVNFPEGTLYERLAIKTTGAMMASSQNRCGVPNLCTLSGDVFWKLYRYTGDDSVLGLIQECVHNVHQYLSRSDNPITTIKGITLADGSIHECIQTGDWAGPTGEIPYEYPTSWTEVAHLLSICELPGIYWLSDQEKLCVFDHLRVQVSKSEGEVSLLIENPTRYAAKTTLYVESSSQMKQRLPNDLGRHLIQIQVPAGEVTCVTLPRQLST